MDGVGGAVEATDGGPGARMVPQADRARTRQTNGRRAGTREGFEFQAGSSKGCGRTMRGNGGSEG